MLSLAVLNAGAVCAACAGEQSTTATNTAKMDFLYCPSLFELPQGFTQNPGLENKSTSSSEFRPHGPSVSDPDPRLEVPGENFVHEGTIWQRMSEFRNKDRVQVLTLWQMGSNSVSLQSSKHGDPWLQFTSRLTRGPTQGLLDRLIPAAAAAAPPSAHAPLPQRPVSQPQVSKPTVSSPGHFGLPPRPLELP